MKCFSYLVLDPLRWLRRVREAVCMKPVGLPQAGLQGGRDHWPHTATGGSCAFMLLFSF